MKYENALASANEDDRASLLDLKASAVRKRSDARKMLKNLILSRARVAKKRLKQFVF